MRNTLVLFTLFAVCMLPLLGCGGTSLAPVSGTVTYKGEPVSKLTVVFSPQPVGDNHAVGPFSMGVTDDAGKFSLKTRHKDNGAVVGQHTVAFEYTDIGETEMSDTRDELEQARADGDAEEIAHATKRMNKLISKLKGRPVLQKRYTAVIEVPAGGSDDLILELSEMAQETVGK